jgi:hypothetical protein
MVNGLHSVAFEITASWTSVITGEADYDMPSGRFLGLPWLIPYYLSIVQKCILTTPAHAINTHCVGAEEDPPS